jgi:hypothetical protein
MTQEQATKLAKEYLDRNRDLCSMCPHELGDPHNGCTVENCAEFHMVLGIQLGYNKALGDLKAPKTLAENRED